MPKPNISISLDGTKELRKALDNLDRTTRSKFVRSGLRVGARLIVDEARARVPVRSGALKKAIKVQSAKSRKKGTLSIRVASGSVNFKGQTYYGGFIEYGYHASPRYPVGAFGVITWASHARGTGVGTFVPPRPFMRPAFRSKGAKSIEVATAEIWRQMSGYANKQPKGRYSRKLGKAAFA